MAAVDAGSGTGDPSDLDEYSGGALVGVAIACMGLTTVFLALRFYARTLSITPFAIDDGFILAAYIVNLGFTSLGICQCHRYPDY